MQFPAVQVLSEKGAVFAEAALALVVFFLIVLGFIDFTQMMALQSQLTVAAEQALTVAATDPGIDAYEFGKNSEEQPEEFKNAQNRALERARSIVSLGNSAESVEIAEDCLDIPRTAPHIGAKMSQVLETTPIQFNLSTTYTPILKFLPPMPIQAKAVGYREPRKMIAMPNVVDCNGNVLGSPLYKQQPCPYCSADKMWDFDNEKCVCRNNPLNEGTCTCPAGKVLSADFSTCVCENVLDCSWGVSGLQNNVFDTDTCACKCKLTGDVKIINVGTTSCGCSTGATAMANVCKCPSCGLGLCYRTGDFCKDECIAGSVYDGPFTGWRETSCKCLGSRIKSGTGRAARCVCNNSTCEYGKQVRPAIGLIDCAPTCTCGTGASLKPSRGSFACTCDKAGVTMDANNNCTQCSTAGCGKIGMVRRSFPSCECACGIGAKLNSAGTECVCENPNYKRDASGNCSACTDTPCAIPGEKRTLANNCACTCGNNDGLKKDPTTGQCNLCSSPDAVLQSDGSACECPFPVGSTCGSNDEVKRNIWCGCGCDASKGLVLVAGTDTCKCANSDKVKVDGQCVCPELTEPRQVYIDPDNCILGCTNNQVLFGGMCVQRSCAVERCKGFTLIDGTCAACPER